MSVFTGSGVAIVTPFTEDGIDFQKLGELIDMHVERKTDAIIICGTTGEASTMTEEEL
ncbi:MAG: 4-hydroxy-tetrahydrodipicolinate synthase, partial [Clostridiales bacterium]|nr:4-hydroxy-tetrahydrodipicolinate synthase [Clostridiales bacterium]